MSLASIERFAFEDASHLASLAARAGWRDAPDEWSTVLAVGDVCGLRVEGVPVAVAARFDFGAVCSLGRLVVDSAHQGRGHARRLLEHLLALDRDATTRVTVVATAEGEPLYRRLGFRTVGRLHKLVGTVGLTHAPSLAPLTVDRLDAVCALDRAVLGATRASLLRLRHGGCTRAAVTGRDALTGYAMRVRQGGHAVLGPVIAADAHEAFELLRAMLVGDAQCCRVDVPAQHVGLVMKLEQLGLRTVAVRSVMSLHGAPLPGDLARRFAFASQAWG